MILYGKQILFNLRVVNQETEALVFSDYFGTVEELNRFLENPTIEEPLIPEITVDICSVHKDESIILEFTYELTMLYPLDEEELEDFQQAMEDCLKPFAAKLTPEIVHNDNCDKKSEAEHLPLSAYKYLCPHCWNEVEKCSCSGYPYFLVQIDVGLQEVVKDLNKKGYFTTATCEGHPENGNNSFYINFEKGYHFDLPTGFNWDDFNVRCTFQGETTEELIRDKEEKLRAFFECVDALPSLLEQEE